VTDLPYPEAVVEGFTLGMFVSYGDCGDAWVRAPDGGVAGLIWERVEPRTFAVAIPPDPTGRWGTYAVNLPLPLTTDAEAAAYLRELLPELRPRWEAWQKIRPSRSQRFRADCACDQRVPEEFSASRKERRRWTTPATMTPMTTTANAYPAREKSCSIFCHDEASS
jgi:hypothetical protein